MNKICTDKNQSRKLIELGIDVNTADMWYPPSLIEYGVVKKWWENPTIVKDIEHSNFKKEYYIPAWTLTALLGVLPEGTRLLKSATDDTYHCDCLKGNIDKWFDNPIDAAYEMVVWLKENGKL